MIDSSKPLPSIESASRTASQAFSRLFIIQLSLDRRYLRAADAEHQGYFPRRVHQIVRRFWLPLPRYTVRQAILMLDFIILFIYWVILSKPFLPREPFTIASQIAYAVASYVIDDIATVLARLGATRANSQIGSSSSFPVLSCLLDR